MALRRAARRPLGGAGDRGPHDGPLLGIRGGVGYPFRSAGAHGLADIGGRLALLAAHEGRHVAAKAGLAGGFVPFLADRFAAFVALRTRRLLTGGAGLFFALWAFFALGFAALWF